MTRSSYTRQIQNRNYLSAVGFKFSISRAPKISFFGNSINIPAVSMGNATQPTYLKDIPIPGDKMEFEDLSVRFLVDENLENYMEIQNWMRGLGFPESLQEIQDLQDQRNLEYANRTEMMNIYSDGVLQVLDSTQNPQFQVRFKDLFPTSLSSLTFDATDTNVEYFTAEVTFKYTIYNVLDMKDKKL
tara:strand:+ start:402 stop:962 length:561 start_codon:yes stop_codon:yes gene_type:complete